MKRVLRVFLLHSDRDFQVKPELADEVFAAIQSGNLFAVTNTLRNVDREREKHPERRPAPTSDDALAQDLELQTLWSAMAAGDDYLYEIVRRALLSSLTDPEAIVYRQHVLEDCLEHPDVVRRLYALALTALEHERKVGGFWTGAYPGRILHRSVQILKLHVEVLRQLRDLAAEQSGSFRSEGFVRFFAMLQDELTDSYLENVDRHLRELEFKHGLLQSVELGQGFKGERDVVRTQPELGWRERLLPGSRRASYSFTIPPRDENGFRALEEIRGRGLNQVANAVAQSADHVKSFFSMLRLELAFYLGCLNLHERLREKGGPTCFPAVHGLDELVFDCDGLYDVSLALHVDDRVVGNDVNADGKSLVVVTGANQGGKSTFLRSVGLAQLMLQAGMFVGANALRAGVVSGIFTHYKREEDAAMESGKLDEELSRMSEIADRIAPYGLLLCNESFASTNEREGSEIARQVVRALLEREVRVVFVTHMYDLAHGLHAQRSPTALFLRAERLPDGSRTFRLREQEPLPTSYGEDSYRRIFRVALAPGAAASG